MLIPYSQIYFRRGSSKLEFFFSLEWTEDNVGGVELNGDGKATSIVGGSEECSLWKMSVLSLVMTFQCSF